MFKSKLMEMCQKNAWSKPEYEHSTEGPGHNLRFSGAVTVKGLTFRTAAPPSFASLKQAYNEAARLAFLHFSASPDPDPDPNLSSLSLKLSHPHLFHPPSSSSSNPFPSPSSAQSTEISTDHHNKCISGGSGGISKHNSQPTDVLETMEDPQINFCPKFLAYKNVTSCPRLDTNFDCIPSDDQNKAFQDPPSSSRTSDCLDYKESVGSHLDNEHPINGTTNFPASQTHGDSLHSLNDIITTEAVERHIYKGQLHIYAQKKKCTPPTYTYECEGPSHDRRFKSKVTVDDQTFESSGFFHNKKEADNAAAKFAFLSLSADGLQEDLFRKLLLELAHREGFGAPTYATSISGVAHMPVFVSTVTIEGEIFQGPEAKTKKLAEINAAKIVYMTLMERKAQLSPKVTTPICNVQNGSSCLIKSPHMNVKDGDITIKEQPEKNRVQVCPSLKVGTPNHGPSSLIKTLDMEVNAKDIIIKEAPKNNRVKECQSVKVGAPSCVVQNGSSSLIKPPAMKENVRDIEIEEQPEKNIAKDQAESVEVPIDATANTQAPCITSPKSGAATRKPESSSARSEDVSYSSSELSGCTSDSAGLNFEPAAGVSTLPPFKKIMVLPRSPNMSFPPGVNYGKVLPMSNDEWVALDVNPNTVNNSMPGS